MKRIMKLATAFNSMLFIVLTSMSVSAAEPIKIGVLLPMSGVLAALSSEEINGMKMAIDEFGGAIAGRKIELFIEDDESKPNVGLEKARKLVFSDHIDILTGVVSSAVALAVGPFFEKNKIPVIISNAGANALTAENCSPWIFRVSFSNAQMTTKFGPWLTAHGVKRIFILTADFVSPREMIEAFRPGFVGTGGQILGEAYSPFGQTQDFGPYLAQAKASNPDAIMAIYYGSEAILFTKQYQSFGLQNNIKLVSTLGLTPPMLLKAEGDAAAGVLAALTYIPARDTPKNNAFQKVYQEKYKAVGAEFAVYGYDAMQFILKALKSVNGKTNDKPAILAAIRKIAYDSPRGPMAIDPKTNNVIQNIYISETVKQGDRIVDKIVDVIPNVSDPSDRCRMVK
jgi:branched-chain amino acid transport system substrate-binding protein